MRRRLSSTITRTLNIFKAAGVPPEQWSDLLYQARGLTQEHTAQIRKTASADSDPDPPQEQDAVLPGHAGAAGRLATQGAQHDPLRGGSGRPEVANLTWRRVASPERYRF